MSFGCSKKTNPSSERKGTEFLKGWPSHALLCYGNGTLGVPLSKGLKQVQYITYITISQRLEP